jgi:hypothetical protein
MEQIPPLALRIVSSPIHCKRSLKLSGTGRAESARVLQPSAEDWIEEGDFMHLPKNVAANFTKASVPLLVVLVTFVVAMLVAPKGNTKVLVQNSDCRVTQDTEHEQKVSLRISHLPTNTWTVVQFSKDLLPLKEGMESEFQASVSKNDTAAVSYNKGVLRYVADLKTNGTHDEVELTVSPNLEKIEEVKYERQGLGIARISRDPESFNCKFKDAVQ